MNFLCYNYNYNLFQTIEAPKYILWYYNGVNLNYDSKKSRIRIEEDESSAQLIVEEANHRDSGNYTCTAPATRPATIKVYVSQGEIT